jgi:hypothetical protein
MPGDSRLTEFYGPGGDFFSAVKSPSQSALSENRQLVLGQAVTRKYGENLAWIAVRRSRELTPPAFRRTLAANRPR